NTTAYKEYYAYVTGVAALKPKAIARKKRGDSDTSLTPHIATPTPITAAAPVPRLSAAAKEETRQEEEESFDPIPRTPEGSEDEGNDEEDQDLRLSEEARIKEEETSSDF
nr:hypothetical protein [Tanacetum cinerariifolium]